MTKNHKGACTLAHYPQGDVAGIEIVNLQRSRAIERG
jgi:hypothetical protein